MSLSVSSATPSPSPYTSAMSAAQATSQTAGTNDDSGDFADAAANYEQSASGYSHAAKDTSDVGQKAAAYDDAGKSWGSAVSEDLAQARSCFKSGDMTDGVSWLKQGISDQQHTTKSFTKAETLAGSDSQAGQSIQADQQSEASDFSTQLTKTVGDLITAMSNPSTSTSSPTGPIPMNTGTKSG